MKYLSFSVRIDIDVDEFAYVSSVATAAAIDTAAAAVCRFVC